MDEGKMFEYKATVILSRDVLVYATTESEASKLINDIVEDTTTEGWLIEEVGIRARKELPLC